MPLAAARSFKVRRSRAGILFPPVCVSLKKSSRWLRGSDHDGEHTHVGFPGASQRQPSVCTALGRKTFWPHSSSMPWRWRSSSGSRPGSRIVPMTRPQREPCHQRRSDFVSAAGARWTWRRRNPRSSSRLRRRLTNIDTGRPTDSTGSCAWTSDVGPQTSDLGLRTSDFGPQTSARFL